MSKDIEVLIIEDDARVAEINRRFVERVPGYRVVGIALDEEEAKEQLSIFVPDLVLLDIYFPNFNGLELLAYIQHHYTQTDVIMVTAAKDIGTVRAAIKKGAYDFIIKPIIFHRLRETLVKYQEFRKDLNQLGSHKAQVEQEDVDQLLKRIDKPLPVESLPKGIDKITLEKVKALVQGQDNGITAEQTGKVIGVSRTTARRYLEYLSSVNQIKAESVYGEIGRPERLYSKI